MRANGIHVRYVLATNVTIQRMVYSLDNFSLRNSEVPCQPGPFGKDAVPLAFGTGQLTVDIRSPSSLMGPGVEPMKIVEVRPGSSSHLTAANGILNSR